MGYVVPKNIIKASSLLCQSILTASGGASAIANTLDWDRQYVHKYMQRGYIPLVQVYDISQLLKVSEWTISYHKLMEVFGEGSPKIETVIRESGLLPAEKRRILDVLTKG